MRKVLVFILTIIFVTSNLSFIVYSSEKHSDSVRTNVYINDVKIPTANVKTKNYIRVNDLKKCGFDVLLDEKNKEISIYQNPNLIMNPIEIGNYRKGMFSIADTEFKVNIHECPIEAKRIWKDIVIDIESFVKIKDFNFEKRMDNKDNTCDIYITNSNRFVNSFTKRDKTNIHITQIDNYFYSENDEIGLIKNNIEWISLDYIKSLIKFDVIGEGQDKDSMHLYFRKGDYSVRIQVPDKGDAFAEYGRFDMDLTAPPLDIDGKLHIPLVDSIQLFNLKITRDKNFDKYRNKNVKTAGFGNMINGINIIKNDDWFYYVNTDDSKRLYKANKDFSENIRIGSDSVKQFYIDKNEIFYIKDDYTENEKGIYKMNLDGTNSQQIAKGDISFLNISDDALYYCGGAYGGNLYKIDKDGRNSKTLIEGKIIYPNIVNGWVYYINTIDNNSIYRFRLDGGYNVKISNTPSKCLNADNKKVYFSNSYNSYFMNHDGSFKNILYDKPVENILISQNNIFWIDGRGIYKQNKNSVSNDLVCKFSNVRGIGLENDNLNVLEEKWLRSF